MTQPRKTARCAIYTRKSTEHNLDLEFNSLDAQREACEAYIKSQAHEGWRQVPGQFDDGGISGASLDRPAIQALLLEIEAGNIDIVVVYKVDRLTRSLADFAKLVELFDRRGVSFVSITQAFNTTTSMGRLTLNVLLSFAQFEREVIGERVRDKISASKRKGIWVGGPVPLGYASVDKKIVVIPLEAETVRTIFRRYLELRSIGALLQELDRLGIQTKSRNLSTGKTIGGGRFGKGGLNHLLKNRFYIAEIFYHGEIHQAEHEPILERSLFNAVQARMADNNVAKDLHLKGSPSLLAGRIFDDRDNRMTPSHTVKNGVRYRYYVSQATLQRRSPEAGSVPRVAAPDIEALVLKGLSEYLSSARIATDLGARDFIERYVIRVVVKSSVIEIELVKFIKEPEAGAGLPIDNQNGEGAPEIFRINWRAPTFVAPKGAIHVPPGASTLKPETRDVLLKAIAKARNWVDDLLDGRATSFADIADAEEIGERQVRLLAPLAFVQPRMLQAIVDGSVSSGLTVTSLARSIPLLWTAGNHAMFEPVSAVR
jgi:site-specific DNA recombinase